MKTINVLPEVNYDAPNPREQFEKKFELAKICDYRPQSVFDYMCIEDMDRKLLMKYNIAFFNYCIELCKPIVDDYVKDTIEYISDEYDVKNVHSLDDLLRCGYYGKDYESSRKAFANNFVEDVNIEQN